jgi:hypothetical protein
MRSGDGNGRQSVHDRPRLGELLVRAGCITPAQLQVALREQSSWGGRLGQSLVDQGLIDEGTLAAAIARQLYLCVVDLDRFPPPQTVTRLVPVTTAEQFGLIPVAREPGRIVVACVDPTNNEAMREVLRTTGLLPVVCVATASQIDRAIRRHYYGEADPRPTPHPHLDRTGNALAAGGGESDRLKGLEQRLDRLLDLVREQRS